MGDDDWRRVAGPGGALRVYDAPPARSATVTVLLCHDLPREPGGAADLARAYPPLADRLSEECGCRTVVPMLRGAGGSDGDFSAAGWLDDAACVIDGEVARRAQVWLVGFGFGGAVALRAAARDTRVRGVVSASAPADFAGWVSNRERLLEECRRSGVVSDPAFPPDPDAWADELLALAPLDAAAHLGGRPLLVAHGSDDAEVPTAAARGIADAGPAGSVDLRVIPAAGHLLAPDPRAFATIVGWVERHC